jgi:hypothetical protein
MVAGCLLACSAATGSSVGWELQETSGPPAYAAAVPSNTNLNIESVVLACERADDGNILQLQLFPAGGDVSIRGIGPPVWSGGRRAEISIDDKVFSASVLFADDYVVLANQTHGRFPVLSEPVLDAMATGRTMTLRLPIDGEFISGKQAASEGYAAVDLQAGQGSAAVAALRRCAAAARLSDNAGPPDAASHAPSKA